MVFNELWVWFGSWHRDCDLADLFTPVLRSQFSGEATQSTSPVNCISSLLSPGQHDQVTAEIVT